MSEELFDEHAEKYKATLSENTKISGEGPEFFAQYKVRDVGVIWDALFPDRQPKRIVDYGCGVGLALRPLLERFPDSDILGLDTSARSIEAASQACGERCRVLRIAEGEWPPEAQDADIVFSACVFHHIPHALHPQTLEGLWKMLRPGGLLVLYEHNPYNPLTRHMVNTCPFDADAELISARRLRARVRAANFQAVKHQYRMFFPKPLASLRGQERRLTWCPMGAQYLVYGVRPNA